MKPDNFFCVNCGGRGILHFYDDGDKECPKCIGTGIPPIPFGELKGTIDESPS